ncbi:MAG: hypothetical protein QNJ53_08915 [Pleurocapsa sp. MO_192.B19]|nr:hypothetical protein [Pleurocapsa sp. MO_192.B19]
MEVKQNAKKVGFSSILTGFLGAIGSATVLMAIATFARGLMHRYFRNWECG